MNRQRIESFVSGCVKLGKELRRVEQGTAHPTAGTPEELYDDIVRYASLHPVMGNLLKQLVKIPEAERTYGKRPLTICHGDLHAKNFGFVGGEFAAVYDFDKLTEGLACSDLVNSIMERI